MKTLTLLIALVFSVVCVGAAEIKDAPKAVVLQFEGLSEQDNISIHQLFHSDANYEVINSCQLLGLIVIRNQNNLKTSVAEAKAYIQQKVESLSLKSSIAFIENKSSMDVSMQCRAKVAELHNQK